MMEITALFPTFSFDTSGLIKVITERGWEVKKVQYDKKTDRWTASAKAPHGEEVKSWGKNEHQALVHLVYKITHLNSSRSSKVAAWQHSFVDQLIPIAEAYAKAPLYETKAAESFMELAHDCERRMAIIAEHLTIQIIGDPEPYSSPEKMYDDIRKRRQLKVSNIGTEHTIWSHEEVIAYRVCHDILGYAAVDAQWDWEGENRAFSAHVAILPAEAQSALFTESIGKTAYATYYRAYGPNKIALLKHFFDPAQKENNPHGGFRGVHPSQMLLPTVMPEAKPPHESSIRIAALEGPKPMANGQLPVDINAGYTSQVASGKIPGYQIPMYDHQSDPLGVQHIKDMAGQLHTGWAEPFNGKSGNIAQEWELYKQQNPDGAESIRQEVANAIRAAAISPRNKLHHNAQQYQDLMKVNPSETDPNAYWRAIQDARRQWNVARFGPDSEHEHEPWNRKPGPGQQAPIIQLAQVIAQRDPSLDRNGAWLAAQREILHMKTMAQQRLEEKYYGDGKVPAQETDQTMWLIDQEANDEVLKWIAMRVAPSKPHDGYQTSIHEADIQWPAEMPRRKPLIDTDPDAIAPFTQLQGPEYEGTENHKYFNTARYGGLMGEAVFRIARLTEHLDDIIIAALEDVHDHDGSGHHFRTYMLSLNVPGVGPKVISFIWLFLSPLQSQLATIDVHMQGILKTDEKDAAGQGYFRLERELQGMRDAQGLANMPLAQYQWLLWDMGRSGAQGASEHQDHSVFRTANPTPAHEVRWLPANKADQDYDNPVFESLRPAAQAEKQNWEDNIQGNFRANETPVQAAWPQLPEQGPGTQDPAFQVTASTPWLIHPETGQRIIGQEGQTKMEHFRSLGLGVNDVWNKFDDSMVGAV